MKLYTHSLRLPRVGVEPELPPDLDVLLAGVVGVGRGLAPQVGRDVVAADAAAGGGQDELVADQGAGAVGVV